MAKPVTQKIKLLSTAGTGFFYVTKNDGPHPERQKCRWSSITEEDRLAVIGELERLGALYVSASELKDSHRGY